MKKMPAKRFIALLLIAVLLLGIAPAFQWEMKDGEHHIIENLLDVQALAAEAGVTGSLTTPNAAALIISAQNDGGSDYGSVSLSGNVATITAKGYKKTSGCNSTDTASTTTVTFKNSSEGKITVVFAMGGSASTTATSPKELDAGSSFTVTVKSGTTGTTTGTVTISSITLAVANYTTTFGAATGGSYTVTYGGADRTVGQSYTESSDTPYILSATPAGGFFFSAWVDGSGNVLSTVQNNFEYAATGSKTIRPTFTEDPLGKIAQLNGTDTSASKFDYADFYSYYEPSGYTHVTGTESGSHPSTTATALNYNSYEGTKSSGNGKYIQRDMENVSWSVSGSSITASRSGTSYGDNSGFSNKDGSVKTNAKVLRIHATQTINVSFDYSVTEWMEDADNSISNGRQIAFIYSLITDSAAPNLAALKAGTSWGGNASSYLEDASHSGHFEETISAGKYLYLWICGYGYSYTGGSNDGAFSYSFSSSVSNVVIRPEARTFSIQSGNIDGAGNMIGGGTISINNTDYPVGSNGLASLLSNLNGSQHVSLAVKTAPTGYTHIGWRIVDNGTTTDVFDTTHNFNIESDSTIYALFSPNITVTAGGTNGFGSATYQYKNPSGTEVTGADQYIARSSDGTVWYKDLGTAFGAQATVVLVTNVELSGSFTVPSGKTLSVPYSLDDVATTDLQRESGSGSISSYVTLTVTDSLTVSGNLVASARQEMSTSGYGRIFGKAGYIRVDGNMSVSGTGKIYAYGMIVGDGTISVASGGYVYEILEIRDMRAIEAMMSAYQNGKAFPFNNFFIKNVEAATTYESGSYLKAKYYVNVSGITADGEIPVIGKSSDSKGMFKIAGGSLTKAFSAASPYNNKIIFRAENGSNIQTGSFAISMVATIAGFSQNVNIDTTNYVLPLGYAYAFEVENGGSLTINDDYKMLPGALVNVKEGGTLTISSGKKLVLYRANDYDFRGTGSSAAQGFSSTGYPTAFTKPTDLSYATNNAANVGSAKLNVDGTMNVSGGLYVTNQTTGNTTYGNGYNYLTGSGTINITGTLSNGSIYEEKQKGSDTTSSVTVAYVAIKGITNYGATTDDGQTDYTSLTQATWYGWLNDSNVNVWTTTRPVALTYDANGGTGTMTGSRKPSGVQFTIADCAFTAPAANATFVGWNTNEDGNGTAYNVGDTPTLTADTVLYAQWAYTYTVQWVNADGTVLETDENVAAGTTPTYDSATPTKAADAQYTYTFDKWTPDVGPIEGDTTYTATYTETVNQYTVTFKDDDGHVISSAEYDYGTAVANIVKPENPSKAATDQYTYTFTGWSPTFEEVQRDIDYTATYISVLRSYTVTFWNENVSLQTGDVAYGASPTYSGATPAKPQTASETFTFAGWENTDTHVQYAAGTTLPTVTGNVEYRAYFTSATRTYTITWKNEDGSVIDTTEVAYNVMPTHDDATKEATAEYSYTFAGWTPELAAVTGDAAYTATFTSAKRSYTITWKNDDGTVIGTDTLEYGTTPSHADPSKAATAQYTYTFTGWTPEIATVTGDATYTATYSGTTNTYEIVWKNWDDTVLETDAAVPFGETPSYDGATPAKAATAQYTYEFAGWTPTVTTVSGSATYTATYNKSVRQYTIRFVNEDGTVLQSKSTDYGVTPAYEGDIPSKTETAQYTYAFSKWSPDIVAVTEDATYTAVYTSTVRSYTITWKNDDGTVIGTDTLEYGATPSHADASKANTAQYTYTFTGWSPTPDTVTGPATYTAQYSQTTNAYTVTWVINGEKVETDENVLYGAMPSYDGATPTKAEDSTNVYSFSGWLPEKAIVTGNVTYTAQFTAIPKLTITYLPNGGSGSMPDQIVVSGELNNLSTLNFERTGYKFVRWMGNNGKVYENGEAARFYESVTLTAQWEEDGSSSTYESKTYTITWIDGQLATELRTDYVEQVESIVPPTALTYIGYHLQYWVVVDSDGKEVIAVPSHEETIDTIRQLRNNISEWVKNDEHKHVDSFVITATYEEDENECVFTAAKVIVDGDSMTTVEPIEIPNIRIGGILSQKAEATIYYEGATYHFSHWQVGDMSIPSENLYIKVTSNSMTVNACYQAEESEQIQIVYTTETFSELVDGVQKVGATLSYHVPEGAEAVSAGFFRSRTKSDVIKNEDHPELDNASELKGKYTATAPGTQRGIYSYHVSSKSNTFKLWMRAYVTYTLNGEVITALEPAVHYVDWDPENYRIY